MRNPRRLTGLRRTVATTGALLFAAGTLAACGSDDDAPAASGSGVLADVCPSTVVIQADWEPEAEHGGIYSLLGDDYTIDAEAKSVTGPLMSNGEDTGVNVEIRIGGSSVGYQSAQSLMYQDRDIMFGYGRTTEYMRTQADTPVTAVLATMETSPYAVYWDSTVYPDVKTITDLKDKNVAISTGPEDGAWLEWLVGTGQIDRDQIDLSDQNKPAKFVAAKGKIAEAGFITAEPFMYEEEIKDFEGTITGQLLADAGYPEYFQALVVRTDDIEGKADCLSALVPIMQQAQVDYIKDGTAANALIVDLVEQYDTGWVYSEEAATYAHDTAVAKGVLADGADGTMGSFDTARVDQLIDIVTEYSDADVSDVTADDLVTNQFLDTSISAG